MIGKPISDFSFNFSFPKDQTAKAEYIHTFSLQLMDDWGGGVGGCYKLWVTTGKNNNNTGHPFSAFTIFSFLSIGEGGVINRELVFLEIEWQ